MLAVHRDGGEAEHLPITAEALQWAKHEILAMAPHISASRTRPFGASIAEHQADASMVRSMTGQILEACMEDPVKLWTFILAAGQLAHCTAALAALAGVADPFEPWMADERP